MNFDKLKPWNWFKHENEWRGAEPIPVKRRVTSSEMSDPFLRLHQEMDRLFEDAFRAFSWPSPSLWRSDGTQPLLPAPEKVKPRVDVSGDAEQYQIELDLPGMTEDDVDIELDGNRLTIRAERTDERESKGHQFYRVERAIGRLERTLTVPDDVSLDDIQADMKHGVLTLSLPRMPQPEGRVKRIAIRRH